MNGVILGTDTEFFIPEIRRLSLMRVVESPESEESWPSASSAQSAATPWLGPASHLQADDDLSEMRSALQIPQRLAGFVKRKDAIDDWTNLVQSDRAVHRLKYLA